jgi:hypothetical protein
LRVEWAPPTQSWKSRKIAVAGNKSAISLDCHRRKIRIGDEIAAGVGATTKLVKYPPMSLSGLNQQTPRRSHYFAAKLESLGQCCRWIEWLASYHPDKSAEDNAWDAKRSVSKYEAGKPASHWLVIRHVGPMCMHKHINVEEQHQDSSRSFSSHTQGPPLRSLSAILPQ